MSQRLDNLAVSRQHPARSIHIAHESGTLLMRPMLMTDAEEVSRKITESARELRVWMPWSHHPQTALDQLERLRDGEADYFAGREMVMGLFRDSEMLSMVGLHPRTPLNPRGLEVGYWTPTQHTRKGWTTLGVRVAAIYAFDKLNCERLQVSHDEANVASQAVIEKCGFEREGMLRHLVEAPSPELSAAGLRWSGKNPIYALWPEAFAELAWVPPLRNKLRYRNLLGQEVS